MKKTLKKLVFVALIFFTQAVMAQNKFYFGDTLNTRLSEIADTTSTARWISFKNNSNINPFLLFSEYNSAFGLRNDDQMALEKSIQDSSLTHHFFKQLFKGVLVENGNFIVHEKNRRAISANGIIIQNITANAIPTITEQQALQYALSHLNATLYAWESPSYEQELKDLKKDSTATYYPKGELLFTLKSDTLGIRAYRNDLIADNFILSYKFNIKTIVPNTSKDVYVDAISGDLIKFISTVCIDNCINGEVQTFYDGYRYDITTHYRGFPSFNYKLEDHFRHITSGLTNNNCDIDIPTGDNSWTDLTERPATSGHWAAEKCYDYYLNIHSRPGMDANFYDVFIQADYDFVACQPGGYTFADNNNAAWSDPYILLGRGDGLTASHFVSLDVVGHEWTHGVIKYSSQLGTSQNEAGALSESFGDIFGEAIEAYVRGSCDYIHDADEFNYYPGGFTGRRSLINPKDSYMDTPCPDTYGSSLWNSQTGNHQRAGIQNKMFYLLAEGDADINDIGNNYCVEGIGLNKAAGIAYKALVYYLAGTTSNSTLMDARIAWINTASDYYGQGSQEYRQAIQAWYAVGVGSAFTGPIVHNNLTVSNTQTIAHNNEISFNYLQVTPTGNLTVSSNTKITMNTSSKASSDSYFRAFIGPGCTGGAKYSNSNSNNYSEEIANETKIENNDKVEQGKLILLPNPNNGFFSVQITNISQQNREQSNNEIIRVITIYDMVGKVVYNSTNYSITANIDISYLQKGMYFIKVQKGDRVYNDKVLVE